MVDNAGPTAKPLRADARRNRELVLVTAQEMLSTDGMSVSFDEIARRAGVGVGTVYRHFPTRDALFEAVVLGRIEQFVELARTSMVADAEPGEVFLGYFAHVVGAVALNQALCDAMEPGAGAGFAVPEKVRTEFRDAFSTLLHRAQAAGEVRFDLDDADVLDLLIGAATAERLARLRGAENDLLAVILAGLRARKSAT
ncbi:TetR/AcrR family transcriptional regulator [Nocardia sp. NPDC004278]